MRLLIRQTLSELRGAIIAARTYGVDEARAPSFDSDPVERWESLRQSVEHLRGKLRGKADQLLDMFAQAEAHFAAGHADGGDPWQITLGVRLMQDAEEIARGKTPFAYPKELWRWGEPLPTNDFVVATKH